MDKGHQSQDVGNARMSMGNKPVKESKAEFPLNKILKIYSKKHKKLTLSTQVLKKNIHLAGKNFFGNAFP